MKRLVWGLAVAAVLAVSGCGGGAAGSSRPVAEGGSVDISGVAPCDALTADQLVELGLRPDTARPATGGPATGCQWTGDDFVPGIVTIVDGSLADMTAPGSPLQAVEAPDVAGLPAIRTGGAGGRACGLYIGASDRQVLMVLHPTGACTRMAEMAVANLRG